MLFIADVEDKEEKCISCSRKEELIEIRALDTKVNIYSSIIICEQCKRKLIDRLKLYE